MKIIEVIPNPYIALDKDGVPQAAVSAGVPGVYIGAQLDGVASRKSGKMRFYYPANKVGGMERKVKLTADVLTAVLAGELIVANLGDALLCGISKESYLPPEKALAAEKEKALAYYRSVAGPNAALGEIPRKPTAEDADEPPAAGVRVLTAGVSIVDNHATTEA